MRHGLVFLAVVFFIAGCGAKPPVPKARVQTIAQAPITVVTDTRVPSPTPTRTAAQTTTFTPTRTTTHTTTFTPTRARPTASPTPYPVTLTATRQRTTPEAQPSREFRRPTVDVAPMLPDLRTLPPTELGIEFTPDNARLLHFTNMMMNWGPGKLQVVGVSDAVSGRTVVQQDIFLANGSFTKHPAGIFLFHPTHTHWHFENFSRYEIWSLTPHGELNELVSLSDKVSYCLRDTGRSTLGIAPEEPEYIDCEAGLQGMSAGWIDSYPFDTPGQTMDITALTDGVYALNSIVDPPNRLLELDENNNSALVYFLLHENTITMIEPEELQAYLEPSQ